MSYRYPDMLRTEFDANIDVTDSPTTVPAYIQPTSRGTNTFIQTSTTVTIFAIVLVIFICIKIIQRIMATNGEDIETNEEEDIEASSEGQGTASLASRIQEMSTEERTELYSKIFDKNKNQTVLDPSSIIVSETDSNSTGTSDTKEEESCEFVQDEDPSIYMALQVVRSSRRSTILSLWIKLDAASGDESTKMDENSNNVPKEPATSSSRRSSLIHPRHNGLSKEKSASMMEKTNLVGGNCVICFEDMHAGETVVWSEHKACQHVYHKHCMVAYLAHKKQSLSEIEQDENPCPTCRRNFLTVCPHACVILEGDTRSTTMGEF